MPLYGKSYKKPVRKYTARRLGKSIMYLRKSGRIGGFNPNPVFTETYKSALILQANQGFVLTPTMDGIPQLAQYSNLYKKYRILSCTWTLIPDFLGGTDINTANNPAQIVGAVPNSAQLTTRIVYAINNSPSLVAPASEAAALQDNGCKIRTNMNVVKVKHRPVPDLEDVNNNFLTLKKTYLNFKGAGNEMLHYGVSGYVTVNTSTNPPISPQKYMVYAKLTFQLSDPQ